jgi:DNA polymerase-3 subunit delta'
MSEAARSLYPWQLDAWQQIARLRQRMPHALLFFGPQGCGKSDFAQYLAKALLCETPQDGGNQFGQAGHPCGKCASCTWFELGNHPDYRLVRPEMLEDEPGEEAETDSKKSAKASKTPSKEIKIDQIRALADFMNVSTHRQGLRVVVLYPAEALNLMASNALLKTLEEPPPATVFLLVTHRVDRLLPTILSRCRQFALAMPDQAQSLVWLQQQGVAGAAQWLAEQGGAPLLALQMAQEGNREELDWFLQQLMQPGIDGALKTAEKLAKVPLPTLLVWLQRWLYDLFSYKLAGKIRYYPQQQKRIAELARQLDLTQLLHTLKLVNQRRAFVDHPLAPKLFIEDMLLDYSALYA